MRGRSCNANIKASRGDYRLAFLGWWLDLQSCGVERANKGLSNEIIIQLCTRKSLDYLEL